jgi:hypothetical protein
VGCDIHSYIEMKIEDTWVYAGYIVVWRNYHLFAKLADVRNDGSVTDYIEAKGLPSDVSSVLQDASDRWGRDAHSHSYLTLQEIEEIDLKGIKRLLQVEFMRNLLKLPFVEDVRLVFWFDN